MLKEVEEEVVEEILKECNISEGLAKLLIKICKDNGVETKKIKKFIHKFDTPFDTLK